MVVSVATFDGVTAGHSPSVWRKNPQGGSADLMATTSGQAQNVLAMGSISGTVIDVTGVPSFEAILLLLVV